MMRNKKTKKTEKTKKNVLINKIKLKSTYKSPSQLPKINNTGSTPSMERPPYIGENTRHLSYGASSYIYPGNQIFIRIDGTVGVDARLTVYVDEAFPLTTEDKS